MPVTMSDAAVPAPSNPLQYSQLGSSMVTSTAKDAAIAMNSIGFITHLARYKESDDIKSYKQSMTPIGIEKSSNNETTRGFYSWIGLGGIMNRSDNTRSTEHLPGLNTGESNYLPTSHYSHTTTHETVTEYNAKKIWFLPSLKDGVRFREIIRVISISTDGQSSSVECTTQYHNGSRWVDCSRVICKFSSDVRDSSSPELQKNDDRPKMIKMYLENEVLIWLPLPKAAIKAVGKKILSVFEQAALDFFHGLYASK